MGDAILPMGEYMQILRDMTRCRNICDRGASVDDKKDIYGLICDRGASVDDKKDIYGLICDLLFLTTSAS